MDNSENNNMSEGMYVDAMNQLRDINNEREKELESQKEELKTLKKELLSAYGIVRLLDMLYNQHILDEEGSIEIKILIETLRTYLSQFIEDNILD